MDRAIRVGIFDSGAGGLSVLYECIARAPACTYYYYGDNVRAPYGSRPREEIERFTFEAFSLFEQRGVDAAVVACNTASAVCLEKLRARFSFPVIGMEPAVVPAAKAFDDILVLATPVTARSERLKALVSRFPEKRIEVYAPERLAGAIERHLLSGEPLDLREHLPRTNARCAVLGCTHYALIKDEIFRFLGIPLFDGGEGTAARLCEVLRLGINVHFTPPQNPNKCLTKKLNIDEHGAVIFDGSGKNTNEFLFFNQIRFRKI